MIVLDSMIDKDRWISDMSWLTVEYDKKQLDEIWNSVSLEYKTIEQLESELEVNRDSDSIFMDVNLHSIVERFEEFEASEFIEMIHNRYGLCVDIYYLTNDNSFLVWYGFR